LTADAMSQVEYFTTLPGSRLSHGARAIRAGLGLALAGAVASIFLLPLVDEMLPKCLFRELTGVSCLTCGITRSLESASHGEILASVHFHLLGPFILVGMVLACAAFVAEAYAGRRLVLPAQGRWWRHVFWGGAAAWIIYGVVRAFIELL